MKRSWAEIDDSPRPLVRVLIPEDAIKRVIGVRGAVIGGIATTTQTHMNISKEPWPGTTAKVLTVQSKAPSSRAASAAVEALKAAQGDPNSTGLEEVSAVVLIPVGLSPLVMGVEGSRVHELEQASLCQILVQPSAGAEHEEVALRGPADGVELILQVVCEAQRPQEQSVDVFDAQGQPPSQESPVQPHKGRVPVPTSSTTVAAALHQPVSSSPTVGGKGTVSQSPGTSAPVLDGLPKLRVLIPDELTKKVIGERGNTIGSIAKATSTHMNIGRDYWEGTTSKVLTVVGRGAGQKVAAAATEALRAAHCNDPWGPGAGQDESLHAIVILPVRLGALLIGKGGSRVQELQQATDTFISLKRPPPGVEDEEMTLQGTAQGIQSVLQAVIDADAHSSKPGGRWWNEDRGGPSQQIATLGAAMGATNGFVPTIGASELSLSDDEVLASPCTVKMQLPPTLDKRFITGKGGSFMMELTQQSGADKVDIEDAADGNRWLDIQGSLAQVQMAMLMMTRRIASTSLH